jgi:hypothetical protein
MGNNSEMPKRKHKIRNRLLVCLVLLYIFVMIESKVAENDYQLEGYLYVYTEMVYPDFSGNGGGGGESHHDMLALSVTYRSGPVSITGNRYFFSNQLYFTNVLPEKTFFPNDSSQSIDPTLIDRVTASESASLDITFETFRNIEETKALAAQYNVDAIWMAFDNNYRIQLGIPDQPEMSDGEIRTMFMTVILNEKYVNGHDDFKEAVKTIFTNDFRIIGFRVVGATEDLLNLLKDPMVMTFRIDKLDGVNIEN